MTNPTPNLPPGFRFHPTDEELILHYLRKHAASVPCPVSIIAEVDIYKFDPWDLPKKAMFGEHEWYFFSPRDRKYPNGVRPNRAAGSGYWKATGTDKPISNVGVKKALVFYKGKPPRGTKTNWIMHEYRLAESQTKIRPLKLKESSMRLDDWVLCRIYKKTNNQQEDSSSSSANIQEVDTCTLNIHGIPKAASLTDIFKEADFSMISRLLEAPTGYDEFGYANWNQHFSGGDAYESGTVKRQREDEDGYGTQVNKKNNLWTYNNLSNYDSQAFFNQQMVLKAHLGMQ